MIPLIYWRVLEVCLLLTGFVFLEKFGRYLIKRLWKIEEFTGNVWIWLERIENILLTLFCFGVPVICLLLVFYYGNLLFNFLF